MNAKMKFLEPDQYAKYIEYRQSAKFEAQKRHWRNRFFHPDNEMTRALDDLARDIAEGRIVR